MRQKSYASKKVESVEDWVEKLMDGCLGAIVSCTGAIVKKAQNAGSFTITITHI